jgi:hypothetical protein
MIANNPTHALHSARLSYWDALAADPARRAALPISEVLDLLAWNDPNGEWGSIADARQDPSSDPDGEFQVSDEDLREALETMMKDA